MYEKYLLAQKMYLYTFIHILKLHCNTQGTLSGHTLVHKIVNQTIPWVCLGAGYRLAGTPATRDGSGDRSTQISDE